MKRSTVSLMIAAVSVLVTVAGCDQLAGKSKPDPKPESKQESKPVETVQQEQPPQKAFNLQETVADAQEALSNKNFGQAEEIARSAVNAEPKNAKALFVLAEAQGANSDTFGALKSLDDALKNGYDNKSAIYGSEYLEKTRSSAGFKELMAKYGLTHRAATPAAKSKRAIKGTTYSSEDSIRAGDVKINMKEVFKDNE